MTGRIEASLKEIYANLEQVVDNWMRINYIETLTHLPKAMFRKKLYENVRYVLDHNPPDFFGEVLNGYLQGTRDRDGNHRQGTYITLAKEITEQVIWDMRNTGEPGVTISEDTVKNVESMATSYGVALYGNEAVKIAQLLHQHDATHEAAIRGHIVSMYVVARDVPTINKLMNEMSSLFDIFGVERVRSYAVRLSQGENGFNPQSGMALQAAQLMYKQETAPMEPNTGLRQLFNLTRLGRPQQLMSSEQMEAERRIGNQIVTILKDSAIDFQPVEISQHLEKLRSSGISSPRGVEMSVKAVWSSTLQAEQRLEMWMHAMLMEWVNHECTYLAKAVEGHSSNLAFFATRCAKEFDAHATEPCTVATLYQVVMRLNLIDEIHVTLREYKIACNQEYIIKLLPIWEEVRTHEGSKAVLLCDILGLDCSYKGTPAPIVKADRPMVKALKSDTEFYRVHADDDEYIISREFGIHPDSEMPLQGAWVIRDFHTGQFVDSDKYRADLFERNRITI